ncbi:hypothetical protein BGZ83_009494 [Gryganskiella cystojenkinii]|nr:hypothetical protein BGZ83_009494 [Gryganskiella cystojenkinii]
MVNIKNSNSTDNQDMTTTKTKSRRFSMIKLFNHSTGAKPSVVNTSSSIMESSDAPSVPSIPANYRHSMAPTMEAIQSQMLRERRRSIAAVTDSSPRATSLDLNHSTVAMTEKMRQFDELLQKRRGSTIRISLTPSLLQESS